VSKVGKAIDRVSFILILSVEFAIIVPYTSASQCGTSALKHDPAFEA
jgi:hypothetical protein